MDRYHHGPVAEAANICLDLSDIESQTKLRKPEDEPLLPMQTDLLLPGGDSRSRSKYAQAQGFAMSPTQEQCDQRPQSPELTGTSIFDTCDLELSKLYGRVKNSVAQAVVRLPDTTTTNWGTAFKYCDQKVNCVYITNQHVAENADYVGLVSSDGKTVEYVKVLVLDEAADIAIIDVPDGDSRPSVDVGVVEKKGEPVFTVGHPLGLPQQSISPGYMADFNQDLETETGNYSGLSMSTVRARPGGSGSPEFNRNGQVTGIKSKVGLNGSYSVPIDTALRLIPQPTDEIIPERSCSR